ncbi:hypothetical protein ABMX77_22890, partial [Vibrio vulnificus]|uniref:hypothetical protein n=1 Tax=Vibrio vulnificus TaxID=672 RepID=UPI00405A068A
LIWISLSEFKEKGLALRANPSKFSRFSLLASRFSLLASRFSLLAYFQIEERLSSKPELAPWFCSALR